MTLKIRRVISIYDDIMVLEIHSGKTSGSEFQDVKT